MADIVERLREYAADYTSTFTHDEFINKAADEIERLRDLLGKANALARIRGERLKEVESDPAFEFCHRFAILMECMVLSSKQDQYWDEATNLLSDYHYASNRWRESRGEPYVSGFGKD